MSFTCPDCGLTSYNQDDEREGYCARCNDWTGQTSLALWTIYHHPRDVPGVEWCVRRWRIFSDGRVRADVGALPAASLDAARALIPPGLAVTQRKLANDPAIVETWV